MILVRAAAVKNIKNAAVLDPIKVWYIRHMVFEVYSICCVTEYIMEK